MSRMNADLQEADVHGARYCRYFSNGIQSLFEGKKEN